MKRCVNCTYPIAETEEAASPFTEMARLICKECDDDDSIEMTSDDDGIKSAPRADGGQGLRQ